MKLTKENIQFIDNYLQKSEVFYADIRMEMIDHVASAVEVKMEGDNLDFYDAFKGFMVINKKEILKGNKENHSFDLSIFRNFGKFIISPGMLFFGIAHCFAVYFIIRTYGAGIVENSSGFLFNGMIIALAFVQIIFFFVILKKRFYYLEKSGFLLLVLYYFTIFFMSPGVDEPNVYVAGTFFYFFAAYTFYFINEVLVFTRNNKMLYA